MEMAQVTRRTLLGATAGAVLCSAPSVRAQSRTELTIPSILWSSPANVSYVTELKAAFEAANPSVAVSTPPVPSNVFFDKQLADVSAGNPPDIATLYDPDMRAYLEGGLLEPLDDILASARVAIPDLIPTASLAVKDGRVYGIPMQMNVRELLVNTRLLEEAGLTPPRTLDDFNAAVRRLRNPARQQFGFATLSRPGGAGGNFIEMAPIVVGFGGGFFRNGRPSANAPETAAALAFMKQLYDENLIPRGLDFDTYRQLFVQGRIGMYAVGPFLAASAQLVNPETYRVLSSALLPFPGNRTISVTVFFALIRGARNKPVAERFLATMLQDQWQRRVVEVIKASPARRGMVPASFVEQNPWFRAFADGEAMAVSYAPEGAEQYGNEIARIVNEHVEAMLFRGVAVAQTVETLQRALEEFIATKQRR
jgi:multiple sugar transport system substrate-binding protein